MNSNNSFFQKLFNKSPAFKLLFLIFLSIVLSSFIDNSLGIGFSEFLFIVIIAIVACILLLIFKRLVLLYLVLSLICGFIIYFMSQDKQIKLPYKVLPEFKGVFIGKIEKILYDREKVICCLCEGKIITPLVNFPIEDKIILSIFKDYYYSESSLLVGRNIASSVNLKIPQKSCVPGEFSERQWASSNDAFLIGNAKFKDVAIWTIDKNLYYYSNRFKEDISQQIDEIFSEEYAPLIKAMLLGEKTSLSNELREMYSKTGTAHLFAISGFHIGIISVAVLVLLGFIKSKWLKFTIFTLLIIAYVFFTGLSPSAVRAGLLAILAIFVYNIERKNNLLNLASFVVLMMMVFDSKIINSVGFQMSSSAILGIALFFEPIRNFLAEKFKAGDTFNKLVIAPISVTISASIAVSPIVAYYFGIFSLISPIANLFVIPLVSLALIFALIAVIFSYLFFPIATYYATSSELLLNLANYINEILVTFPSAFVEGNLSFYFSVFTSLVIIYLLFSDSLRQLLSRLVITLVFAIMIKFIYFNENETEINLYPREQYVFVFMKDGKNKYAMIIDRKPDIFPKSDYAVESYILKEYGNLESGGKFYLGYNGNVGINMIDKLKKKIKPKYFLIDLKLQDELQKILGLDEKIPQVR